MIAHADTIPPARHPLIAWILRWTLTTNHKEIGTLYLCLSFALFIVGGAMAMVFRAELRSRACSSSAPTSTIRW